MGNLNTRASARIDTSRNTSRLMVFAVSLTASLLAITSPTARRIVRSIWTPANRLSNESRICFLD